MPTRVRVSNTKDAFSLLTIGVVSSFKTSVSCVNARTGCVFSLAFGDASRGQLPKREVKHLLEKKTKAGYVWICRPYITLKNGRVLWAKTVGKKAFCFWAKATA
jgi:hypothetical protein